MPVHQQEEFKKQLIKMQQAGVLVPVNQSTPWISNYVNVESEDTKGGKKFHICLDLINLNKVILHEPFFICTPNDVHTKLSKAKMLTVIDFKKGFWQVELNEVSSYLTTFNTPFGYFRFTCLPFGLTVSGDIFQHKLDAIYGDLPLTIGCADEMIIWGEKDDLSDNDEALDKFLQVTREHGLCLGFDKIQYKRMKSVSTGTHILLMVTNLLRKRRKPLQRCPGQQMSKSYKAFWECVTSSQSTPPD